MDLCTATLLSVLWPPVSAVLEGIQLALSDVVVQVCVPEVGKLRQEGQAEGQSGHSVYMYICAHTH